MSRTTETDSDFKDLESQSSRYLLEAMNAQDQTVPLAIKRCIDAIEIVVENIVDRLKAGGRLFYIGSGSSGRLGVLDAAECPPTFGVSSELVQAVIAGGDAAIRKAVEFAEDDREQGWKDLQARHLSNKDFLIGISASGSTPYVLGAIQQARAAGVATAGISCNENSELSSCVEYPIDIVVGPEFITGSTRLKSGSAQKMVLNMISTAVMIRLGHVQGNHMIDMQLTNEKLIERGTRFVMQATKLEQDVARKLLLKHGSVRKALDHFYKKNS